MFCVYRKGFKVTALQNQIYQECESLNAEQQQQVLEFITVLKNQTQHAAIQTAMATHQQVMAQYHDLFQRLADA